MLEISLVQLAKTPSPTSFTPLRPERSTEVISEQSDKKSFPKLVTPLRPARSREMIFKHFLPQDNLGKKN